MRIAGVVLAGGRGVRLGGADKALLPLAGRPLLTHVLGRLAGQVQAVALNANGDPARFAGFGVPVLPDAGPGFDGPLAGVLAGLVWALAQGADAVVSVAVDTPFFPDDLVVTLQRAGAAGAMAVSPGGAHPAFALWPVAVRGALSVALAAGQRRVRDFADAQGLARAGFPDDAAFYNINTPGDLAGAEALLRDRR